jgi:hypothetical protein
MAVAVGFDEFWIYYLVDTEQLLWCAFCTASVI